MCLAANKTSNSTQAQTLAALSTAATNATGLASTAFQLGRQVALTCILSSAANVGLVTSTGWTFHNNSGNYGSNYLLRARKSVAVHCIAWPSVLCGVMVISTQPVVSIAGEDCGGSMVLLSGLGFDSIDGVVCSLVQHSDWTALRWATAVGHNMADRSCLVAAEAAKA